MTNADKIRQMTDEELAIWIVHKIDGNGFDGYGEVVNAWLEWLKEEVKDGSTTRKRSNDKYSQQRN